MKNKLIRTLSFILTLVMTASFITSCKKDEEEPAVTPDETLYDLTGFTIVREADMANKSTVAVSELKQKISEKIGLDLNVVTDSDLAVSEGAKEILIGATNRMESSATISRLGKIYDKNAYAIIIVQDKIVITGTSSTATEKAIKLFSKYYVEVSGKGNSHGVCYLPQEGR